MSSTTATSQHLPTETHLLVKKERGMEASNTKRTVGMRMSLKPKRWLAILSL